MTYGYSLNISKANALFLVTFYNKTLETQSDISVTSTVEQITIRNGELKYRDN